MLAVYITLALAMALSAALALDLRAARGEPGGRAATITLVALVASVVAALLPIGALLPHASLDHVASVPSWDVVRPCVPPPEPSSRFHAIAPVALSRLLFPVIVVAALGARPTVRPRRLLAIALAFALAVIAIGGVRTLRGGAEVTAFRACGALTPEEGADASSVRAVINRMIVDGRQEVIRWRELPRLPRPPWVRSEIPVTIGGDPWVLRVRGKSVVAEPDDVRRADRPLPALHFASVPTLASGADARGKVSTVLIDYRPDGKLYAVRVGRAVQSAEIGPLLRAPRWPVAIVALALVVAVAMMWMTRVRSIVAVVQSPYRTAPASEGSPLVAAVPAVVALILIETSATALHALLPYL
jgi:hypothetical protein